MTTPDKNYLSLADVEDKHLVNCYISPKSDGLDSTDYDDILKFSHAKNCSVTDSTISGEGVNHENAIDMNRSCSGILVKGCNLISGRQNAITIKGGCNDITIENVVIVPGAGHCDIDLGNFSDQCDCPVTNVKLINVTRSDGQPVRVRVINADKPIVTGGNVAVYRPFWGMFPIWTVYTFLRRKGIL